MSGGTPRIELDSVSVSYADARVLRDISLKVMDGDFMAVTGPNGGGKTTLFRTVLGLMAPSRGRVAVDGVSPNEACGRIGYMPQFGKFDRKYPITVEEVVRMGLRPEEGFLPRRNPDAGVRVTETMERTGIEELRSRRIGDLSGGQMQRMLLARALVSNPGILLLDEPTASIDPDMRTRMHSILADAKKDGVTVMMITHDTGDVSDLIDRIVRVDGTVTEMDPSDLRGHTEEAWR